MEKKYKNPLPTVDVIIEVDGGIVLIERRNPPYGWAIPGGFVDEGESLEDAAMREAFEETSLIVKHVCIQDAEKVFICTLVVIPAKAGIHKVLILQRVD